MFLTDKEAKRMDAILGKKDKKPQKKKQNQIFETKPPTNYKRKRNMVKNKAKVRKNRVRRANTGY